MNNFNVGFIRHGDKINSKDVNLPLERSGLTLEQQRTWKEAVVRLGIEDNPQMKYENLPLIEELARVIYAKLPEKATVIFSSTDYPRTRLTADLISSELIKLSKKKKKSKEIAVAFMWEHPDDSIKENSRSNIGNMQNEAATNQRLLRKVKERDFPDDLDFEEYLKHGGSKTFSNEDEVLRRAVNLDLESPDSQYRSRVDSFKAQLKNVSASFQEIKGPVFFYFVGHHPNLITFDVALNGRKHYATAKEIPKPLTLLEASKNKVQEFIGE